MSNKIIYSQDYAELIVNSPKYGQHRVLIDIEDVEKLSSFNWYVKYLRKNFYICAHLSGTKKTKKTILMHRLITNALENQHVDHISHNTLDNRKQNLRACSHSENMQNKNKYKTNKSGVIGQAHIQVEKQKINLGYFEDKNDAINARKIAEIKYFEHKQRSIAND